LVDAYEYLDSEKSFGERFGNAVIDLSVESPYENMDPRFSMTVVRNGDIWPSYNTVPIETFEGGINGSPLPNATQTGYYLRKYCNSSVNISTNGSTEAPHAWIQMRLGEFYLNYAECMYNFYGDAETVGEFGLSANEAINRLRDRVDVGMPHWSGTSPTWVERYRRERMVELSFEGHRFWDVRRWKVGEIFSTVKTASLSRNANGSLILTRGTKSHGWSDRYYFFPLPLEELKKNPSLTQNPGW
jgi:hypothetical protein